MAAPELFPSCFLSDFSVDLGAVLVAHKEDWAIVECATKNAYGCGEHGQSVVDGLTLYARLLTSPDPTSSLYIHADEGARRAIQSELGEGGKPLVEVGDHGLRSRCFVSAADERFIFLTVVFHLRGRGKRVYDAAGESMTMIPCLPQGWKSVGTQAPVAVRRGGGGDGSYELVLLARKVVPPPPGTGDLVYEDVLCLFTPAGRRDGAWRMLPRRCLPEEIQLPFSAEAAFSSGGQAFWVDPSQGLVHCDLPATGRAAAVGFGFIDLPPGCPPDTRWTDPTVSLMDIGDMDVDRTAGCVVSGGGGSHRSMRFVFIDRSGRHGNATVTAWDLDLAGDKQWREHAFRARDLWKLEGFRAAGLPETEPRFPVVMPDGTLCLLVPNKATGRGGSHPGFHLQP